MSSFLIIFLCRYYNHREEVTFPEEQDRLESNKRELAMLEREEQDLKALLDSVSVIFFCFTLGLVQEKVDRS